MREQWDRQRLSWQKNDPYGTKPIHLLQPPLFALFTHVETVWKDHVSREKSSAGRYHAIGLPSITWTFQQLTEEEFTYWVTKVQDNIYRREDAEVTVRTKNGRLNQWHNYNGRLVVPDMSQVTYNGRYFTEVVITIEELKVIP